MHHATGTFATRSQVASTALCESSMPADQSMRSRELGSSTPEELDGRYPNTKLRSHVLMPPPRADQELHEPLTLLAGAASIGFT
mmetsp:Transcript_42991/g.86155  ORF Transcript_42991/g.86155 Transcript_42991/m.86155 type:complete len:84 (+) Transcript_42991:134-385(+)